MSSKNILTILKRFQQRLHGSTIEYDLTAHQNIVSEINKIKSEFKNKSDSQLKNLSQTLIKKAQNDEGLDELLVEAFALVREAVWRVLKLHPFDVQLMGGIVMHWGKLAEMQTGEGKTLAAVFPVYLNAIAGKGAHVLTFNDYLARRDAQWMGPVYQFLGLSVSFVQQGMPIEARQKAYQSDITYLTAKEAGFDFLRDSLCYRQANIVQRDFNYALIDEADSILIDEARVPLIIAGTADDVANYGHPAQLYAMAQNSRELTENIDFDFDEYARSVGLTEHGLKRVEGLLNCGHLYDEENIETLARLNCALHAEYLLHRDKDYIVRHGKVELVDEFTGRVVDKRRWPDGLQAAIEAKENLVIQSTGNSLNSITLQHLLQLYPKISGMTATAQTAAEEFREFYKLHIVVIPPNKPCIRQDQPDVIYQTKQAKRQALIKEIVQVHNTKRPILVGTQSVAESALLAGNLQKQGIKCEVLNAKRDEFEAKIIAQAGRLEAVTISTNMAGRGTDIRLGGADEREKKQVAALGGLYVIGTHKHESRRIDNQLRGRAGRQGDPGSSRFFISLADDILTKYRLKDHLPPPYISDLQAGHLDHPLIEKQVNRIQRIIEGQNLDIKITLSKYSYLTEQQRKIMHQKRQDILRGDSVLDFYQSNAPDKFNQLLAKIGQENLLEICKHITLFHSDKAWSQYLAEINDIREGIYLSRIGGLDPLVEFHKRIIEMFDQSQKELELETIRSFNRLDPQGNSLDLDDMGLKAPSSTWTYLINDNPFEMTFGIKSVGEVGYAIGVGSLWPLIVLDSLLRKFGRKKVKRVPTK
ncbi:accessory Sec system translocase SecA2 [Chloroflexota bacterium]